MTWWPTFQQGQLNNLMNFINTQRPGGSIYNRQVMDLWVRTSDARFHYDAGFLSLTRRFSHGLSATVHYTFSKTLDQNGAPQSMIALASTPYDLNVDYGPAIWDRPHVLNSFWYWELPFGKGKRFARSSGQLDRIIGGWSVSGIFTASSGTPRTVQQHPQAFGGSQLNSNGNLLPGVLPALPGTDYSTAANQDIRGSGGVGITGDPARRGSGINVFANPETVYRSLRPILLSQDGRQGRGIIRGLNRWNWDVSIRKTTAITERLRVAFVADFINALNHLELADPILSYQNPAAFGVITDQFSSPRQIQLGLRFEW